MKSSLRVVVDARPLSHGQPGGFRGYVRSLMAGLAERDGDEELLLYIDRPLPEPMREALPPRAQLRVLSSSRLKTDLRLWGQQIRRDSPDLVMGTVNYLPPGPATVPVVVTIHDAIGVSARPWEKKQLLPLRARLMAAYWAAMTRRSARTARCIITDSRGAAGEISKALGIALERLTVVPIGIFLAPGLPVIRETRTVLAFASPEPRKNFTAVLDALSGANLSCFGPSGPPRLEIVCTYEAGRSAVETALAARGITDYRLLHRPTDTELAAAYARATVFVWPSFREGFGMPPLEAMLAGCPVVSSSAPVMPEILGDAPLYADPGDTAAFAEHIARILADPEMRAVLSARGRAQAAPFTCRRMAEETAAVWRKAAAR